MRSLGGTRHEALTRQEDSTGPLAGHRRTENPFGVECGRTALVFTSDGAMSRDATRPFLCGHRVGGCGSAPAAASYDQTLATARRQTRAYTALSTIHGHLVRQNRRKTCRILPSIIR